MTLWFFLLMLCQINGVLDTCKLSSHKVEGLTGVKASEFAHIRKAPLARFTVDRLMTTLNRLKCRVEVVD
jgi:predicted XRE-type DNA-binding protein